ncbi:MAG: hypothetical protein B6U72_06195 [Candidatus Altiarchaeales archaeon ex4484_2]|nr:MAG: hypothetical protein B6U72_06195 [Candidatus Altiarchaeales archaeon ex4484_2]
MYTKNIHATLLITILLLMTEQKIEQKYLNYELDKLQYLGEHPPWQRHQSQHIYKQRDRNQYIPLQEYIDEDRFTKPIDVNEEITYIILARNGAYIQEGKKQHQEKFQQISPPIEVEGKPAYQAYRREKEYIIHGTKKLGGEYDTVCCPTNIGGKLAYIAVKDDKYFIVYDNKESENKYDGITELTDINGKPAYTAHIKNRGGPGEITYIVYDGKRINNKYSTQRNPQEINGTLTYIVSENNEELIIKEKNKIITRQKTIAYLTEIDNNIVFLIKHNARNYSIHCKDNITEINCTWIWPPIEVNKKIAYTIQKEDRIYIKHGGEDIGRNYLGAWYPREINGKLAYVASLGSKNNFIVYGGQEIGKGEYEYVSEPLEIGGKLTFAAKKGDQWYIVQEK